MGARRGPPGKEKVWVGIATDSQLPARRMVTEHLLLGKLVSDKTGLGSGVPRGLPRPRVYQQR